MSEDSSDIFIKFVINDQAIPGEATSAVAGELFAGFKTGEMFEIDSFKFAISIKDSADGQHKQDDAAGYGNSNGTSTSRGAGAHSEVDKAVAAAMQKFQKAQKKSTGEFQAFKSGKGGGLKYPVSVQPVTITRAIDKSSTVLMQYCIDTTLFDSVSVVKRKAAGSSLAGQPYLRIDLVGVLMKDVSWSNDEPIQETTNLISRAITIRYRPQLPNGTLGAAKIGFWSMVPKARIFQW